jgi:hypothetical protein
LERENRLLFPNFFAEKTYYYALIMQVQRITPKEAFLSGTDEAAIYGKEHVYQYRGGTIAFIPGKLTPLEEAEELLPFDVFRDLLAQLDGVRKGLISYLSAEGLKLYLHETEDCYVVIAAGEFQPGLHKICIEGIFRK